MMTTYFGDPGRINTEIDRYRAVRADDVAAFASASMHETNRATLMYLPRE
jgi:hypothetical protein